METHAGLGQIWSACYQGLTDGVAIEKEPARAAHLAKQRPTWAVYQADCVAALAGGAGAHLCVNVVDVDPYGDPWPTIAAYFESQRPFPDTLAVVVNDGLRQKVRIGAWDVGTLQEIVMEYGNDLDGVYLEVCQELMQRKAAARGYEVERWAGYYCGHAQQMTHYLAILRR
jgi:hypothetical protein